MVPVKAAVADLGTSSSRGQLRSVMSVFPDEDRRRVLDADHLLSRLVVARDKTIEGSG